MEQSSESLTGWVDVSRKDNVTDSIRPEFHNKDVLEQHQSDKDGNPQTAELDTEYGANVRDEAASGDINMEASISADDVMRAGGFGARDDINNFLPVASDSTDFEASLLDAREYEEPQEEIRRPGLGWTEAPK
ncbi:hypothetical protein M9H77_04027 [Catharanthus roseus]|uniref:Uncharacterized protein n=1 Tax=Catharanthus roseus TaxID=4058 RepID=A0ACC0CDD8_CATRO|nr:hypothetical protein M9H77_04027 [Catharanthus roseus]